MSSRTASPQPDHLTFADGRHIWHPGHARHPSACNCLTNTTAPRRTDSINNVPPGLIILSLRHQTTPALAAPRHVSTSRDVARHSEHLHTAGESDQLRARRRLRHFQPTSFWRPRGDHFTWTANPTSPRGKQRGRLQRAPASVRSTNTVRLFDKPQLRANVLIFDPSMVHANIQIQLSASFRSSKQPFGAKSLRLYFKPPIHSSPR